jgi:hypothetical protein
MREPRRVGRTGLEFPENYAYEEWVEFGRRRLAPAVTQLAFMLGDWLMHPAGLYDRRRAWEATGFLGLDTRVLREFLRVTAQTAYDARDENTPWGSYVLGVARDGVVDERPDEEFSPPRCGGCGGALVRLSGRKRRYCSNACRQRAYRRRTMTAAS